jgi:predicted DNA-binding protein (UPF0251 family)
MSPAAILILRRRRFAHRCNDVTTHTSQTSFGAPATPVASRSTPTSVQVDDADLQRTAHLSQHEAARELGISRPVLQRARAARKPLCPAVSFAPDLLIS